VLAVFVGYVYSVNGPYAPTTSPPGGVYDTDISIENISFDFTGQVSTSPCVASFSFARNLTFAGLGITGASNALSHGTRIIACDRVTMRDVIGDWIMNLLDCWGGTTRVKVSDIDVVQNPGGGNGGLFNLQGVGSIADAGHSWAYEATNINVQCSGGTVFFLDSLGSGAITSDVLLTNIQITATAGTNLPFAARGRGGRIKIHNMLCTALDGATWNTPIVIGELYGAQASETGTNKISTTNGSSTITVTFSTNGTEAGIGNYIFITGTGTNNHLIANGLDLYGPYKILSIVTMHDGLNWVVTCDARANATTTGPIAASTTILGYLGCMHDCELNGITFDGAQTAGQPIVHLDGYGHQVAGFSVTGNYGSGITTPQYSTVFRTNISTEPSAIVPQRPVSFSNILAAPGVGPSGGFLGDAIINYPGYATYPPVVGMTASGGVTGHVACGGVSLGSQLVSGRNDFSKHLAIYGNTYGINQLTSGNMNIGFAGALEFSQGTSFLGYIDNTGLNYMAIGTAGASTGVFTSVTTGGTPTGPSWTTGSAAPAATAPVGSLYSRVGGAVGATLYVSRGAGTWAAVAGV
jgi:hypothetical protein